MSLGSALTAVSYIAFIKLYYAFDHPPTKLEPVFYSIPKIFITFTVAIKYRSSKVIYRGIVSAFAVMYY